MVKNLISLLCSLSLFLVVHADIPYSLDQHAGAGSSGNMAPAEQERGEKHFWMRIIEVSFRGFTYFT